jgi:CHAT domain
VETIDAGDVPLEQIINQLLGPSGLKQLIGRHGAACFALVRPALAPQFFDRLIKNVSTVDATTRNHVAFIVFHGKKSSLLERRRSNGYERCYEYHIEGLSTSADSIWLNERYADQPLRFNDELTDAIRTAQRATRSSMARASELAVTHLIRYFDISESSLPCLAFVDGHETKRAVIVSLSPSNTLESLYSDVLAPLSDVYSRLEVLWRKKREIERHVIAQRDAAEMISTYPREKLALERSLERKREEIAASRNPPADLARKIELLENERTSLVDLCEKFRAAKTLDDRVLLAIGTGRSEKVGQIQAQLRELEKQKKARYRPDLSIEEKQELQQISSAVNRLRGELGTAAGAPVARANERLQSVDGELRQLTRSVQEYERDLKNIQSELERLAARYSWAESEVGNATQFGLENRRVELAQLEEELSAAGFERDVLRSNDHRAISVVTTLKERNLIGTKRTQKNGKMKILFFAANPMETSRLDLEEELRGIENELRAVKHREKIELVAKHAVRADDLVRYIREEQPDVIHFSGHGSTTGIVLRHDRDDFLPVSGEALARLLKDRSVKLVVLNSCYSQEQAASIIGTVEAVVGTRHAVGDEAARRFSAAFYRTLGEGYSIQEAFRDGGDVVDLHGLEDVFRINGNTGMSLV